MPEPVPIIFRGIPACKKGEADAARELCMQRLISSAVGETMLSQAAQRCQDLAEEVRDCIRRGAWADADAAFAQVLDLSTPWLTARAREKASQEQAEDLVADTHLALYEFLAGPDPMMRDANAWMRGVLHNKTVDYYRLRGTTATSTAPPEFWERHAESATDADDVHKVAADLLTRNKTNQLLDALGAEDASLRAVIEAQYLNDEPVAATAQRMRLTDDQIKKRRAKALRRLREIARKRGFDHDL